MLKSVVFVSRAAFRDHIKASRTTIAISIGADDEPAPRLARGFAGAIRLTFDDVYEEKLGLRPGDLPDLHPRHEAGVRIYACDGKAELCDANDAHRILRFLERYAEKGDGFDVVVHCEAGVSRSAAVAQFAAEHYGIPIANANPDTSEANKRLLRLLAKFSEGGQPTVFDPPRNAPGAREASRATIMGIF